MTPNTTTDQQINAPFRAKSAGVSLVAILLTGFSYIARVIDLLPSSEAVPDGALGLVITTVILIAVVETVLQIVLFIGAGRIEARTAQDDAISTKADRNAYYVLTVGVVATFASMFAEFTPFEMGNVLLLAFLLAELVKYGSQIVYYRRAS